ncbi:iron ABC transporter permease [Opitutaceae bacterium TAV5]|nr:iron ABC transporter permease [Opitutaceae bacterium TAV5]
MTSIPVTGAAVRRASLPRPLLRLRRLWPWSGWSAALLAVALLVAVPLAMIFASLAQPAGDGWARTPASTLREYLANSLILLAGVGIVTTVTGVATAWLVAACEFPGRRTWAWLLVLPMALPAYVVAFGYGDLLDRLIPLVVRIRTHAGVDAARTAHDVLRYAAVIAVMSSVLYPYVFIATRTAFATQGRTALEAARMLGCRPAAAFFRVTLPLAWPAIVGGVLLVGMEVLNEYGAVDYFGIPTLTVGIFRFWFSFSDPDSAARIAALAMLLVFALLGAERMWRGRRRFSDAAASPGPLVRYRLRGWRAALAVTGCALPVAAGFALPTGRLVYWSWLVGTAGWEKDFWRQIAHTLLLAGGATLIVITLAVVVAWAERLHPQRAVRRMSRLAVLGYAIPSAVLALGLLRSLGWLDAGVAAFSGGGGTNAGAGDTGASSAFSMTGALLSGSATALVFAYAVRFLAVGFLPAQAGLKRVCADLDASARCLGASPTRALWRINLPLLRPTLLGAAILVFVDIIKELPLTLLLRPFNLETLATRAFNLADQGRLPETAPACLLIIAAGLVCIFALNRLLEKNTPS